MSLPLSNKKLKPNSDSRYVSNKTFVDAVNNDFHGWLLDKSKETGKSTEDVLESIFGNGFITYEETMKINEVADTGTGQPPIVAAWNSPIQSDGVDELRRLRKEFAPVSKAVDYIKSMIIGNRIDIIIDDPKDNHQLNNKEIIEDFCDNIYQDDITISLYSLLNVLLDEALTVGMSGAEIRYETPVRFMDYVKVLPSVVSTNHPDTLSNNKYVQSFITNEPENWKDLKGIKQLKIFRNAYKRLRVYRDNVDWRFNYITLDELLNNNSNNTGVNKSKKDDGTSQCVRYTPWQIFWLSINRREFDEHGVSVIEPVKKTALILEKIIKAVGDASYRNANKKYALICGDGKNNWGKTQIRNTLQLFKEMSTKGWSAIPVPAGFDYKEFGGTVFDASNVINTLLIMIAQGMHVPVDVVGVGKANAETSKNQLTTTFNEIEIMRHEFVQAIRHQLFKRHLWCKLGEKNRTKQGGKSSSLIYVPHIQISTKGLLSPIDEIETYKSLFNSANPIIPELKYEMERRIARIFGFDNIIFMSQNEFKKKMEEREKLEKEMHELQMDNVKQGNSINKRQGNPEPPTRDKQLKRLENGVNKAKPSKQSDYKLVNKPVGGTRIPKEHKVMETAIIWNRESESDIYKERRELIKITDSSLTDDEIDDIFLQETINLCEENSI